MSKILNGIKIQKIGYGGIGLARRSDGKRIMIKGGALPNSIVDLKIVREKKDYIEAHILNIKKVDLEITDGNVFCPHFFSELDNTKNLANPQIGCGGCKRQVMSYNTQLKLKEDIVLEAFEKIKKDNDKISFLPILGSPQTKGYRNKIEFSFGKYITKNPEESDIKHIVLSDRSLGFHKQGEFSKIVNIDNCGLISDKANKIFEHIKTILIKSKLPVYDQKTHQGFFRHLVIREGTNTGQILINLAVSDNNLKDSMTKKRNALLEKLRKDKTLRESVDTFMITYNNGLGDIVRGEGSDTKTFWGEGYIYDKLIFNQNQTTQETTNQTTDVSFRISPFSFFQTNTFGAQQLFGQASNLIGNIQGTVLDLYCGTGSIGISFLKQNKGDKLLGIEINNDAIVDARHNAKINGIQEKVDFLTAPAEKAFFTNPELKDKLSNLNLVIVDPPREGLHANTVRLISDLKKEHSFKLLYISCNPITMKRDIEMLIKEGFELKIIQPVDMFPQTHHIETIGVLM